MDSDEEGNIPSLDVEIVAIPEPGKFRIISKGDGYLYSALQPFQKVLLESWKVHKSSTMTIDLTSRVQEIDRELSELPYWCSVDYEAATDLLKKDASLAALGGIPENIFSDLAFLSMQSGRAFYPDGTVGNTDEGQLMGHPLSFPLLCVINLATYRVAIERWVQDDEKDDRRPGIAKKMWSRVLVNGDDMLFKCDGSFYPIFLSAAKDMGFKISQGKNYLSPDCCMINSKVFRRVNGVMKRFGYLNQRLITGRNVKSGEAKATPCQIGKDLSEMVEYCPWAKCSLSAAFSRWRKDFYGSFYRPNWFLPVHLGGFGVDPKHAVKYHVTRSQRELAARFIDSPALALYRLKSLDIPTAKIAGAVANWRMIPGSYVPESFESRETADDWLVKLAYASLVQGNKPVDDRVMISRLGRERERKPRRLSQDELELYRNVQFFASGLPECPPFGYLKIKGLAA